MAQVSVTDEQVMTFVQRSVLNGKSKEEIVKELVLRGVTRTQAQRVIAAYKSRMAETDAKMEDVEESRAHTVNGEVSEPDPDNFKDNTPKAKKPEDKKDELKVYGRNIFRIKDLNFTPSENLATPRNYRLGPGDEVIIDVFGRNQTTIRCIISPEGSINVDVLGPLYLNGMTVDEANAYLKKRLSQIYGGLNGGSGTDMRLSLGQIRTIQVNVVGDVLHPGTFVLSAFSTAFHALYVAGGIVDPGTMRDIKVIRADKVAGHVDVYDFLMRGNLSSDIRLEEGDVVLVAPYKSMVRVEGGVKRPAIFEMKEGETMADLLLYCGGFLSDANSSAVTVTRQNLKSFEVRTVEDIEFGSFVLKNGDHVMVGELQSRFENRIAIQGAVYFPGTYELSEDVLTAKQLVEKAGGLLPDAFAERVVVHREHEDKSMEVFSLNLKDIMDGLHPDFMLQNNDELYVSSSYDLRDQPIMTINGMVKNPGEYPFAQNTTVEDFIIMAGGLLDGASMSRVDVTRRKKDANGMVASSDIGVLYSISLEEGLAKSNRESLILEPYDEVVVHRSPSYNIQRHFTIEGEVNFPGTYSLTSREEHVSDLLSKAGGVTPFAYVPGARLIRQMTEEERRVSKDLVEIVEAQDSTDTGAEKALESTYNVSIDLEKAMANPGSEADVVLRENDVLIIPGRSNVVRVHGSVMYPTSVNYDPSLRARDYIEAAGGFAENARSSRAYVVNMGGRAKKYRCGAKIEPGSEIYVPEREKKDRRIEPALIVALGTAASSVSTLAVVVYNIIRSSK